MAKIMVGPGMLWSMSHTKRDPAKDAWPFTTFDEIMSDSDNARRMSTLSKGADPLRFDNVTWEGRRQDILVAPFLLEE